MEVMKKTKIFIHSWIPDDLKSKLDDIFDIDCHVKVYRKREYCLSDNRNKDNTHYFCRMCSSNIPTETS